MWLFSKLMILSISLLKGIDSLDSQAFDEWFEHQNIGTPTPALEVTCDWTLPDAGILKKSYTVICPSNCLNVNHCIRVKGSGPFAVNSPVCLAAIHAGVIQFKGGAVEVSVVEGRHVYPASSKNGVVSIPYGAYFASFNVVKSDISCEPTVLPTSAPCVDSALLDIVFVADSSLSVHESNFTLEKKFMNDLLSHFPIGPNKSRIGLITFNDQAETRFTLATHSTQKALMDAILAVPYQSGGTYVGKALWHVIRDMKFRNDQKVTKIVIVFTDGQSFDHVLAPVKRLAAMGVRVIAFGIADSEKSTLLQIANGHEENVYSVASYSDLQSYLTSLIRRICNIADF